MADLAAWLLDRIAEDEAAAREATPGRWKLWGMSVLADVDGTSSLDTALPVADTHHEAGLRTFNGGHMCRWDPARVLAECDAKRRIVEDYQDARGKWRPVALVLEEVLRLLALPYADAPGYREEWRP